MILNSFCDIADDAFVVRARDGSARRSSSERAAIRSLQSPYNEECSSKTPARAEETRHLPCRDPGEARYRQYVLLHPGICGTLDPFDCQAIPATPLLNEAVSFVRFYHNASWSPAYMARLEDEGSHQCRVLGNSSLTAANWLWDLFIADVGTFCSVVASILPIMRPSTSAENATELQTMSLQLKAQSLLRLRKTLQNAPFDFVPTLGLIYHVKALFRESTMDGDLPSASSHAKMLVWLADKLPVGGRYGDHFRRIALWGDAIPALLQLRRPAFDFQQWMPQLLTAIWNSAELTLPAFNFTETDLPSCIRSQPLRQAFLHARRALEIRRACEDGRLQCTELVFQWMITKAETHICNLLNLYFDLTESDFVSGLSQCERHTKAALALALLHIYQKSFSSILRTDGVDIHESAVVVHPALVVQVQSAFARCSATERLVYRDAHFWTLFVGAYCEEWFRLSPLAPRKCMGAGASTSTQTWFHQLLAKQALQRNLESWTDARSVLNQFFLFEFPALQPENWYGQTIASYRDGCC